MEAGLRNSCSSSSLSSTSSFGSSMVSPKSPPSGGLDLFWKRKQLVKVQVLEREIGHLQDELKSIDGLQPASKCCKDLDDFIGAKADPLIVAHQEASESCCSRKKFWGKLCCGVSWICSFSNCQNCPGRSNGHTCCSSSNSKRHGCCFCLRKPTCQSCCQLPKLLCPKCASCCLKLCSCKCVSTKSCNCNCSNSCCCL